MTHFHYLELEWGMDFFRNGVLLFRPLRMVASKEATKSDMTASASRKPVRTEMMSELGFVYFLLRTAPRKTVKVWLVSWRNCGGGRKLSYIESNLVGWWSAMLDTGDSPEEEPL